MKRLMLALLLCLALPFAAGAQEEPDPTQFITWTAPATGTPVGGIEAIITTAHQQVQVLFVRIDVVATGD